MERRQLLYVVVARLTDPDQKKQGQSRLRRIVLIRERIRERAWVDRRIFDIHGNTFRVLVWSFLLSCRHQIVLHLSSAGGGLQEHILLLDKILDDV